MEQAFCNDWLLAAGLSALGQIGGGESGGSQVFAVDEQQFLALFKERKNRNSSQ
jgi:hypothetical protein